MISQTLREARMYEEVMESGIGEKERPAFHLAARVGWMNDPNGFSYYNGEYHLFYQYHPYDLNWGPMHWGHAASSDLLHWHHLPAALAPDTSYDRDGCFSGSAIVLPDGRHMLLYTGVMKTSQPNGSTKDIQTQCVAIGDGVNYEKYSGNPVLSARNLPEGGSPSDFRDPKIWEEPDGTYRCVVGNCDAHKDGRILLYRSKDGLCWEYETTLAVNQDRFGKMWECPDFFELDGKQVLLTSPQDMLPKGFEYHNGNGTLCLIGRLEKETYQFCEERNQSVDYGIDFYAPQTVAALDGRRIMIGWMQNWDTCNFRGMGLPWYGQMSLPRELQIKEGRLIQKPIRELENLRTGKVQFENVLVTDTIWLDGIKGRLIDMEMTIRPEAGERLFRKFAVYFAQDERYQTSVSFRPYESIVKIDRKQSGSRRAIIHQRRSLVKSSGGELKLRLILDRFSAEVFVNDGEQVLSAVIYTDQLADGISFFADGKARMDVVKYDLRL